MARYGQRPENALKRAHEFIEVGKPARALDTLQEVFRNKKWAYNNWTESILEPIMFKYLDLCVELKKSHIAKEGLFQYRNMFQSVNVSSLENVIRGYLRMAEEKTENARAQSTQAVIDIDDLDNLATPESILLSAVSGEDAQDRSDRTILTPWVKFLWESYCQCLELLRTNAHVETLYHDIARMAFQFCLKYSRKTEFRKLCDKLRKHLEDICKLPAQVVNVSIAKPETQQLNLETRLFQLDSAIQMELWQEAYKAIEDIHGLMNMSKKLPVPKTMANYYQKLAMVFWKAGNYLFHAAALFKLFQLYKEMKKNVTQEELQRMACRVLIATLAIPLPSAHPEFDRFIETDKSPLEKAQKLAILLGLLQPPTRASLLKDLIRVNVINLATPQLQNLHTWLEVDFHPLLLCSRVQSIIDSLKLDETSLLIEYIPALQDVTLVRLVRQVAQVYQTIELGRLIEMAQFTTHFHMERLLVDCVRHNDMQIRIDHGKQCIHFGIDLSESQREDTPEGPTLQAMPSEMIRNQLINMSTVLHQAVNIIDPKKKKVEREALKSAMVKNYHETKVQEHQRILERHQIIEDRKEYIERMNTVREEEEQRRLEEMARQQVLAEQKRLEQEREERERKRALNEIQQIKDRHLKEKMQQISQTSHGQRVLKKLEEDDIKKMDADQIAAREAEELQKERRELQAKLKSQEKRVDYFERAKRLEEIPLLQAHLKERQQQDQSFWEQQEKERIAVAIEDRKLAIATRDRLARMKPEKDIFLEMLLKKRSSIYEEKLRKFEERLAEERKIRLAERKIARKEERRAKWLKEKQEEEERKLEEERRREEEEQARLEEIARKEREERERQEREEKEKRMKEQQEMLERAAAKQRAREEEIERKLQEEAMKETVPNQSPSWRSKGEIKSSDIRRNETNDSWRQSERTEKTDDPKKSEPVWRAPSMPQKTKDIDRDREEEGNKESSWRSKDVRESKESRDSHREIGRGERYRRTDDREQRDDRYSREERDRFDRDKRDDREKRGDDRDRYDRDKRDDRDRERFRDDYRDSRDYRKEDRDYRKEDRDYRKDDRDYRDRDRDKDRYRDDHRDIRRDDRDRDRDRDRRDERRFDRDRRDDKGKDSRDFRITRAGGGSSLSGRDSTGNSWRSGGAPGRKEEIRRDDKDERKIKSDKPEQGSAAKDGWTSVGPKRR